MNIKLNTGVVYKTILSTLFLFTFLACENRTYPAAVSDAEAFSSLYVTDTGNNSLRAWDSADVISGNLTPDRVISGPSTNLQGAYGIEYDSRSKSILLSKNGGDYAIVIFDNVLSLDGNITPSRTIVGPNTLLDSGGYDLALDETRDLLYAAISGGIAVFENISTANGDVAPIRVITGLIGSNHRFALDEKNDRLYVTSYADSTLSIYDNVSTKTGSIPADRIVALNGRPWGVAINVLNNIVYLSMYGYPIINIYDNASDINGTVTADRNITGANTRLDFDLADLEYDSATDQLYVANAGGQEILIWHNASNASGDIAPDRNISGTNTGFSRPVDIVGIN